MDINFDRPLAPSSSAGSAAAPNSVERIARNPPQPGKSPNTLPPDPAGSAQTRPADALQQAVDELQRKVQISASNLNFSIDHETGKTVVKVIDANTQEVIRQIPPEEILQLSKTLDRMWGLLLHKQG